MRGGDKVMAWEGKRYDGEPRTGDRNPAAKYRTITKEMVDHVRKNMTEGMLNLFRKLKEHHNGPKSVISTKAVYHYCRGEDIPSRSGRPVRGPRLIPHPVHFREGMQIRNWLRESGLCKDWSDHDLDNNWHRVVNKIIEEHLSDDSQAGEPRG
jgi:hypothetical protein